MHSYKIFILTSALCFCAYSVQAQDLDSAQVQMTGVIADTCSVDGITSISSPTLASLNTSALGAGVKVASLDFEFPIPNTDNPLNSDIGAIDAFQIEVLIDLYCNGEFQFTVEASNGAMVNTDNLLNSNQFTNALTYTVDFAFPDGSSVPSTQSSGAPGVVVSDASVPAQDGDALLTLSFANPGTARPIAGLYTEALTVSFVQDGITPPSSFGP